MTAKKWIAWTLILLILAIIVWLGWSAARAAGQARLALADLRRLQAVADHPSAEALPGLQADLAALETHLRGVQAGARPFLWLAPRLGWLPEIGPSVSAAPALLEMAIEVSAAGHQALDALVPVTGLLKSGRSETGGLLAQVVPALADAGPQLAAADTHLARAAALRAGIAGPRNVLSRGLHPRLAELLDKLDRVLPLARAGLRGAQAAPALLGNDGPRTYLILAQNNHELRATGGFISGVGVARLDAGRIVELRLADSYAVDDLQQPHPAAPPALAEQMGAQILLLRDSNWSPDFPTSAAVARALYQQDRHVATDGAIALDLDAVRLLVAALGPLEVPGMAGPVTADNVIAQMKQAWAAPATAEGTVQEAKSSDWWGKRKDFMGELVTAALAKLEKGGELDFATLAYALLEMLDGRHLQVAVDDPVLAGLLAERNWDGALRPPADSDFLALVESNVGFNKANAAVRQQIAYHVEPAAGSDPSPTPSAGLTATLTITYTHTAPALEKVCDRTPRYGNSYDDMIARCYWAYLRVYAAGGSELIAAQGLDKVTTEPGERGTTVFSGAFVLRPGETCTITLRYRLPDSVPSRPYRLTVRRQAGAQAAPLRVSADDCSWDTDLARDRAFECEKAIK